MNGDLAENVLHHVPSLYQPSRVARDWLPPDPQDNAPCSRAHFQREKKCRICRLLRRDIWIAQSRARTASRYTVKPF
jgi:hypothetical protein